MIKLGQKYKLDKEKMKSYCDKYGWNLDYERLIRYDYLTPISEYLLRSALSDIVVICYVMKEHSYYYPEDCLIDVRKLKLKRVLCL